MKTAIDVDFDSAPGSPPAARGAADEAKRPKRTQRLPQLWPLPQEPDPTRHLPTPGARPGTLAAAVRHRRRPVAVVPHD
jgi:hypothetical protein